MTLTKRINIAIKAIIDRIERKINLKKGQYGYYLQIKGKGKKKNKNLSLPDDIDPDELTKEDVLEYIANINGTIQKSNK